ncbi:hypothetical protein [Streptomyces sp. NPDC017940]|uniref:hypothetical protein n=1 Tax=Streptomyces sp. NPDC017940 TaxID=3365017 RepID=UPI0037962638
MPLPAPYARPAGSLRHHRLSDVLEDAAEAMRADGRSGGAAVVAAPARGSAAVHHEPGIERRR